MELRSKQITIETTNICTANCIVCPREKFTQKLQIMDFNLFKKIIDDAAQYSIECVDINGFGDPFTDKLLFKRLEKKDAWSKNLYKFNLLSYGTVNVR